MYKNPILPGNFLPKKLDCSSWESLEPHYNELLDRSINNRDELENWMLDRSTLDRRVSEYYAWLFIRQSTNTTNEDYRSQYVNYVKHVYPNVQLLSNQLDEKLNKSIYFQNLDDERFGVYKRSLQNQLNLFNEANAPLYVEIDLLVKEYSELASTMTIEYKGELLTMQQAHLFLANDNRKIREQVFELMVDARDIKAQELNSIFDSLLQLRTRIAQNAGMDNYRDYSMRKLERFDYGVEECESLHYAIKLIIKPLMDKILKAKRKKLDYNRLHPYDMKVIPGRKTDLIAFSDADDLIRKTERGLKDLDPYFSECLNELSRQGRLDLDNRYGKAPGGYNMPLLDSGLPFIFMNATGSAANVCTLFHEVGHAVHSILCEPLPYYFDHNLPAEIAELASMSMEFFTLDGHKYFYNNENDILDSQQFKIENSLSSLLWIGVIDEFQHWVYTHPKHSIQERRDKFIHIFKSYNSDLVDWNQYDDYLANLWQKQSHLFYHPFYYIEYGIAQLGAFALWKNYKSNPKETIKKYKEALSLGYTKKLPELYEAAGIKFDFSFGCFRKLADFVWKEWHILESKQRHYSSHDKVHVDEAG